MSNIEEYSYNPILYHKQDCYMQDQTYCLDIFTIQSVVKL